MKFRLLFPAQHPRKLARGAKDHRRIVWLHYSFGKAN